MAPLAPNNTDTYWLRYTAGKQQHELQWRMATGSTTTQASNTATALAEALVPYMHNADSFTGLRRRASGTNYSFPMAWTPIVGGSTVGPLTGAKAVFMSLTGRSGDGRRTTFKFFTVTLGLDQEYRDLIGNSGNAFNLLQVLQSPANGIVSISGIPITWNKYLNFGVHAYFQRKLRRTGG